MTVMMYRRREVSTCCRVHQDGVVGAGVGVAGTVLLGFLVVLSH